MVVGRGRGLTALHHRLPTGPGRLHGSPPPLIGGDTLLLWQLLSVHGNGSGPRLVTFTISSPLVLSHCAKCHDTQAFPICDSVPYLFIYFYVNCQQPRLSLLREQ